jgi:glutamine amidotransferase-like uncharacterized protein
LHQPKCSIQSGNGIIKALHPFYKFKIFTKHEVEDDFFDDVDMVVFPGGVGDADSWDSLLKFHKSRIQDFVARGGYYLGICMGAYWADKYYFDILKDVRVTQYIKQPNTDTRRPHPKAMPVTWNGLSKRMYFYDGCAFVGQGFDVVATYPNGDAMAIVQDNVGLIGCHLESEKSWYNKGYLKTHWHNKEQYSLLLEFVNHLVQK